LEACRQGREEQAIEIDQRGGISNMTKNGTRKPREVIVAEDRNK
jgi:hypothetical protein